MRLWHYKLIPYLPNSQLIAQWRELCSIYAKEDKHILINYIYNYEKSYLFEYSRKVIREIFKGEIRINSLDKFNNYFNLSVDLKNQVSLQNFLFGACTNHFLEHDFEYLQICFYNLKEKYMRGQFDFTKEIYDKLETFYKEERAWNEGV